MVTTNIQPGAHSHCRHAHSAVFQRLVRQRICNAIRSQELPSIGLFAKPIAELLPYIVQQLVLADRRVEHCH